LKVGIIQNRTQDKKKERRAGVNRLRRERFEYTELKTRRGGEGFIGGGEIITGVKVRLSRKLGRGKNA